jgi:hypothetical protein
MKESEKPIEFVMTAAFSNHFGPFEPIIYIKLAKQLRLAYPYDMLIFENSDKKGMGKISVDGYHADTGAYLEHKEIARFKSSPIKKFWLKYDDYGDHWVGTFLFPEDY